MDRDGLPASGPLLRISPIHLLALPIFPYIFPNFGLSCSTIRLDLGKCRDENKEGPEALIKWK